MDNSQSDRNGNLAASAVDRHGENVEFWVVCRQDDNGNRFEIRRGHSLEVAEALVAAFEAKGHKQTYWIERQK